MDCEGSYCRTPLQNMMDNTHVIRTFMQGDHFWTFMPGGHFWSMIFITNFPQLASFIFQYTQCIWYNKHTYTEHHTRSRPNTWLAPNTEAPTAESICVWWWTLQGISGHTILLWKRRKGLPHISFVIIAGILTQVYILIELSYYRLYYFRLFSMNNLRKFAENNWISLRLLTINEILSVVPKQQTTIC